VSAAAPDKESDIPFPLSVIDAPRRDQVIGERVMS